jgi:LysM repeat protein
MDPVRRRQLTRYGAPTAFLAAATVAVLLIKAGLNSSDSQSTTASTPTTVANTTPAAPTTTIVLTDRTSTLTTTTNAQYYVIQAGDTLGAIAARYNTTVEELMALNPGLDPNALHPGDRIRVG